MKKRKYHGWINVEKSPHLKDHFSVHYYKVGSSEATVEFTGYGERGAAKAVEIFEQKLGLGPVKLEQTPLGLRVFTIVEEPMPCGAGAGAYGAAGIEPRATGFVNGACSNCHDNKPYEGPTTNCPSCGGQDYMGGPL